MNNPVYITAMSSVSPLGKTPEEIWRNYKNPTHLFTNHNFDGIDALASFLPDSLRSEIEELRLSSKFKHLDISVLYAVFASRLAFEKTNWEKGESIGINIGSSRGATHLFEKFHKQYLDTNSANTLASPTTTLGNISSWVAQDLQSDGPEISHSVTCSTGLHAVLNAVAWINSGMANKFIAGGSEAALTPFTIAQMKAMKIYGTNKDLDFPCRALDMEKKKNTMILGEAAGVFCLENKNNNAIAKINGVGYATEVLQHSVSISANATCFQKSMQMAIKNMSIQDIDAIVMHAPGTVKGDQAEVNAIKQIFGEDHPALTTNKWKLGHTFGASGILSMELAILMIMKQEFINVPFSNFKSQPKQIHNVLVNAVGFGGNAVSILISKI